MSDVLVETANRTLQRKGYSREEAVVEMVDDHNARLHGSLLYGDAVDVPARLMRFIEMLPYRDELVDLQRAS